MTHDHHSASNRIKNFKIAFFLNLGFTVFELIGGFLTNSLAITSDALHDLGDSLSLGMAWGLEQYSEKGTTRQFTYGYLDLLAVASGVSGEYKPSPLFYGSANGFSESGNDTLKCAGIRSVIGDVNKDGYLDVLFHDKGDFILMYMGSAEGYSGDHTIKVPSWVF